MATENEDLEEFLLLAAEEEGLNVSKEDIANLSASTSRTNVEISQQTTTEKKPEKPFKLIEDGMDSSDEEDIMSFLDRKYDQYGSQVNSVLKRQNEERHDSIVTRDVNKSLSAAKNSTASGSSQPSHVGQFTQRTLTPAISVKPKIDDVNVYTDPVFGIRIVQPLVSSSMLKERMAGRTTVDVRNLQRHLDCNDLSQDWCLAGVIVNKGSVQTSKKGAQYIIWKISDLKGEMPLVSIFLFKNAYKELWKTAQGMVVAILNPTLLPNREGKSSETALSIDNHLKVMILGKSKDLGTCKARKKNGDMCTAIVNTAACEFCVYHVKQEYAKLSTRSELQSATSGRGLQALRNKVLGKNEVFYAGKSFSAEPATKNKKIVARDQQRLQTLSGNHSSPSLPAATATARSTVNYAASTGKISRIAETADVSTSQRAKDLERLKVLLGPNAVPSLAATTLSRPTLSQPSTPTAPKPTLSQSLSTQPISRQSINLSVAPKLSQSGFSFDLSPRQSSSKAKAAEILKRKPIEKSNPNFIKYRGTETGKKRIFDSLSTSSIEENAQKRRKIEDNKMKERNDRIMAILNARSSHTDLVEQHENIIQEQHFQKLEKKEAMEEKMIATKQVKCKAVICSQCKYKAFSAAQRCKDERHPLKVVDAEKRFYECEECKNRTATLFRIPQTTCGNCQSSKWRRVGMMKDRAEVQIEQLSIRGDEETFIGSLSTKASLNLCVAES